LSLADRQIVDSVSTWQDGVTRRANGFRVITYPAARGSAVSYYPETTVLVPLESVAEISISPTSKGVCVRLETVRRVGDLMTVPPPLSVSAAAGNAADQCQRGTHPLASNSADPVFEQAASVQDDETLGVVREGDAVILDSTQSGQR